MPAAALTRNPGATVSESEPVSLVDNPSSAVSFAFAR